MEMRKIKEGTEEREKKKEREYERMRESYRIFYDI